MTHFQTPIHEFAHNPLLTVNPTSPLRAINNLIKKRNYSALPIIDAQNKTMNIISHTDILHIDHTTPRNINNSWKLLELPDHPISKIMHEDIISIPNNTTIERTTQMIIDKHIHRIFIKTNDGITHMFNTKKTIQTMATEHINTPINKMMSSCMIFEMGWSGSSSSFHELLMLRGVVWSMCSMSVCEMMFMVLFCASMMGRAE